MAPMQLQAYRNIIILCTYVMQNYFTCAVAVHKGLKKMLVPPLHHPDPETVGYCSLYGLYLLCILFQHYYLFLSAPW